MDDDKLLREVATGHRARDILEDPTVQEVFRDIESRLHDAWAGSGATAADAREEIWRRLQALKALRQELRLKFDKGRFAADTLRKVEESRRATSGSDT